MSNRGICWKTLRLIRKGQYSAALQYVSDRFHCSLQAASDVIDEYLLQEMPIALRI